VLPAIFIVVKLFGMPTRYVFKNSRTQEGKIKKRRSLKFGSNAAP
jgi:hypothetical protein